MNCCLPAKKSLVPHGLLSGQALPERCAIGHTRVPIVDSHCVCVKPRRLQFKAHHESWHIALTTSAAILSQLLGRSQGGRHTRVRRQALWEPLLIPLGAAAVAYLTTPKSAPGVTDQLIVREERARRELSAAREKAAQADPDEVEKYQRRLQETRESLAKIEAEMREATLDAEAYPVPEYMKPVYGTGNIMIAVTGASGVGKSSFINALRRMSPRDKGAAKTGLTETTMFPEMFKYPARQGIFRRTLSKIFYKSRGLAMSLSGAWQEPEDDEIQVGDRVLLRTLGAGLSGQVAEVVEQHSRSSWDVQLGSGDVLTVGREQLTGVLADCVIWDLPGVGTPSFPKATYTKEMGIRYYDVVILMTATRFTEAELMLVNELRRWKVPFFLVRNKTDADIESEIENEEDMNDEEALSTERQEEVAEETIQTIKKYFETEFNLEQVYCVSTKRALLRKYDFQMLEQHVEQEVQRQRSLETDAQRPRAPLV